jgi:hypothetical protein
MQPHGCMATLVQDNMMSALRHTTRVKRIERELGESALGALVGAVTGAIAGPPGVIVGSLFGAFVGLLAGVVGEREDQRAAAHTRKLDDTIGVTHGSMGTLWVKHMPARIGAFSSGSSGGGVDHGTTPAEGPMSEDGASWY